MPPSAAAPNPFDDEDLYIGIVLAGVTSPGKCTLSGHDRKVNWDIKAGAGQSGATTTLKDIPPVEFAATFYLASREDIAAWPAFQDLIDSTVSGKTPKALDIYHPDLATNDIKSVVKASVAGVVHDGKGGQTITVRLLEYRPPAPKGGSPNGSATKVKKAGTAPDPNAAANAELAALTQQYKATPWG